MGLSLICSVAVPRVALAQQQGTPEQQQACQPDVMRICSNYIPDVDRIVACLRGNEPQLSPACHDVMFPPADDPPPKAKRKRSQN